MKISRHLSIGVFVLTICCACVETPEIRENVPTIYVDDVIDYGIPSIELIGHCSASGPSSCEYYFLCASSKDGLEGGTVLKAEKNEDGAYSAVFVPKGEMQLWYRFCAKSKWSFVQSDEKSFKYTPAPPKKKFTSITWNDNNGVSGDIRLRYDSEGRVVYFSEAVNSSKSDSRVEMSGEYQGVSRASFNILCIGDSFHSGYARYNAALQFDADGRVLSADVPGYSYSSLKYDYSDGFVSGIASNGGRMYNFEWIHGNVSEADGPESVCSYEYLGQNDLNGIFPYFFDPSLLAVDVASPLIGLFAIGFVPDNVKLPSSYTNSKTSKGIYEYTFDEMGNVLTVVIDGTVYRIGYDDPVDYSQPVDMGTGAVKWAQVNLGAYTPSCCGSFYAWGETSAKEVFGWDNYMWGSGRSSLNKYCLDPKYGAVDMRSYLSESDDAATTSLGEGWRMPTRDEFNELLSSCSLKWTEVDAVSGLELTSLKTGATIFLPAVGECTEKGFYGYGNNGAYWSSGDISGSNAAYLGISNKESNVYFGQRYSGYSVRPVFGERVRVQKMEVVPSSLELEIDEVMPLKIDIYPSDAVEKGVVWSSDAPKIADVDNFGTVTAYSEGEAVITATAVDNGVTATCSVKVNGYSNPIDLGLPSGTKWGQVNLGASKPQEYGEYYAWGETQPKASYSLDNYKWYKSGFLKYTWSASATHNEKLDYKTLLDASDDAATVVLGDEWRIPTGEEFQELLDYCDWKQTTRGGVDGYEIKSRKNGAAIFLPFAGGSHLNAGTGGAYWSSCLLKVKESDEADNLWIDSKRLKRDVETQRLRGYCIRPVYGAIIRVDKISLAPSSLSLKSGETAKVSVEWYPADASYRACTFVSSNASIVTVDSEGNVLARALGKAVIYAYSGDGGRRASCTVTVAPDAVTNEDLDRHDYEW